MKIVYSFLKINILVRFLCVVLFLLGFCNDQFAQIPIIDSFSPLSAKAGTSLVIHGKNFNPIPVNNIVRFGVVKAVVTSSSATSIQVVIPDQASYGPISVINNNLIATSNNFFSIIFPGGGNNFALNSFSEKMDSLPGGNPDRIAITDIDNDQRTDLALLQNSTGKVVIYRNTGNIGRQSFAPKQILPAGNSPSAITFADLDGDGNEDLIVCNTSDKAVGVYRNISTKGVVSFAAPVNFSVGGPCKFAVGKDFNNDGKIDIAVTNSDSNTVGILTNISITGIINFSPPQLLNSGSYPINISAADLDGDNKTDLAVINEDDSTVSIFKNASSTSGIIFSSKTDYHFPGNPLAISSADLNGDNKPELFFTYSQIAITTIMANNSTVGNISFGLPKNYSMGFNGRAVAAADMNGDGKPDVIITGIYSAVISMISNKSAIGNIDFDKYIYFNVPGIAADMLVNDFDGDSRPDLAFTYPTGGGGLEILRNTVPYPYISSFTPDTAGNGSIVRISGQNFGPTSQVFIGGMPPSSYSVDSPASITAVIDTGMSGKIIVINDYGNAEKSGFIFTRKPSIASFSPVSVKQGTEVLIHGINFTGTTSVLFGDNPALTYTVLSPSLLKATVGSIGTGSFPVSVINPSGIAVLYGLYTGPVIIDVSPGSGPIGSKVIISGTHFSDIIDSNVVYFGSVRGNVSYADSARIEVLVPAGASYEPVSVTTAGLTAFSDKPFAVTFSSANPQFTATTFNNVLDSAIGATPLREAIADFNNDGKNDIAAVNAASNTISVLENSSSNFQTSFKIKKQYVAAVNPERITACDFDGDGKKDLVVTAFFGNNYYDSLYVFRNISRSSGAIAFDNKLSFLAGYEYNPGTIISGDFDFDGKPDIAFATYNSISVLKNTSSPGNISFEPPVNYYNLAGTPYGACVSDIDMNGKQDIIICGERGVFIMANLSGPGTISFTPIQVINSDNFRILSVAAGDFDNDGLPDLAISNGGNDLMAVYKNTSSNGFISFAAPLIFHQDPPNGNLTIGDLNGDGKPDIAVLSSLGFSVFKNNCSDQSFVFEAPVLYNASPGHSSSDLTISDLNGDGKPDISLLLDNGDAVDVYQNNLPVNNHVNLQISVTGSTEICTGDSASLQSTVVPGAVYLWYRNNIPIPASNASIIKVVTAGSYIVSATSGGITQLSDPVSISVKLVPSTPLISSTAGIHCQDHHALLVSSAASNNQWYLNNIPITGATENNFRASGNGSYTVITSNDGCNSMQSQPVGISRFSKPSISITPSGNSAICDGDSIVLHALPVSNLNYQWTVNDNPLTGATSPNYSVYYTGTYKLRVDSIGCAGTSTPVSISVNPVPLKPVISLVGTLLQTNSLAGNQWYRDGSAIAGATGFTYQPVSSGTYSITTSINGCTSAMSDSYSYTITGVVNLDNSHFIMLSPNPAAGSLRVLFSLAGITTVDLQLTDVQGKLTGKWNHLNSGSMISLTGLPAGIYFVGITNASGKINYTLKILKQ